MNSPVSVCILNSGGQDHYLLGLVSGLAQHPWLRVAVIDFDRLAVSLERHANVKLLPTGPDRGTISSRFGKAVVLGIAYLRTLWSLARAGGDLVHIQWLVHFETLDRLLIPLWCKLWGKRMLITVHNVDPARRNHGRSGFLAGATLRFYYRGAQALIAHTSNIRADLEAMGVPPENILVIPHGINQAVPRRGLSVREARAALGLPVEGVKVLLLFGALARYKGIDLLLDVFEILSRNDASYRLIIAGRPAGAQTHRDILERAAQPQWQDRTRLFLSYIADEDIEPLFAASDCVVLPYRAISQSGVPFLALSFGVPVVATSVGGLAETIQPGINGMLAAPENAADLARAIEASFAAGLHLPESRERIRKAAEEQYSWSAIGQRTAALYRRLSDPQAAKPACAQAKAS